MTPDTHAQTLARLRQVNRQLRKVLTRGPTYERSDPRLLMVIEERRTARQLLSDIEARTWS